MRASYEALLARNVACEIRLSLSYLNLLRNFELEPFSSRLSISSSLSPRRIVGAGVPGIGQGDVALHH